MQQHLENLKMVFNYGDLVKGRNGWTKELFGLSNTYYDVNKGLPIITTKFVPFKVVLAELLCFIRGNANVKDFQALNCNIWNANATSDYWKANPHYIEDSLGRIYGVQWRDWICKDGSHIDQLKNMIQDLKTDPHGRRHIVTAWNPGELDEMCLPPCHIFYQCNVTSEGRLNLMMYQRSCDLFLGNPFDITSYCLLMYIICHQTGYTPGNFIHHMGSCHIYEEHFDAVKKQLKNKPHLLPRLRINAPSNIALEDYELSHFELTDYTHHEPIKVPMIV